jgi:hypothetical protein
VILAARPVEAEVGVPGDADPIEFETLDLKLGRRVEKPEDGIDFDADVDGGGLEKSRHDRTEGHREFNGHVYTTSNLSPAQAREKDCP